MRNYYEARDYYYVECVYGYVTLRPLKGRSIHVKETLLYHYVGEEFMEPGAKVRVTTCGDEIINIKAYG